MTTTWNLLEPNGWCRQTDTDKTRQAPVLSALPHLRRVGLYSCRLGLRGCMAVVHALKDRDGMLVHLGENGVSYGSSKGDELRNMAGIHVRL